MSSYDVFRTEDDFGDEFAIEHDAPEEWCAVVRESGRDFSVILRRPQIEELSEALRKELGR